MPYGWTTAASWQHDATMQSAASVRAAIRAGDIQGTTAGLAPGYVQGNVVILPAAWAADFEAFCRANPAPCPILAVGEPGDPTLPALGRGIDIRTDLPFYRVFQDGAVTEAASVEHVWQPDLVSFVIGCSFTFDDALRDAGLTPRHMQRGRNVSMYRTNRACLPAGGFAANLVVSMRPYLPEDAARAAEISGRFATMHGAPVHMGDPAALGIARIEQPDFGDPPDMAPGTIPVFWACGVTSQVAIETARPPLAITHAPGCMLITDRPVTPTQ